jgi:hypothetical protein
MNTFFLVCALLGGATLLLQLVLGLAGVVDGHHFDFSHHDHPATAGLDLFSIRSLAAGVAFFGVGGLFGIWLGIGGLLAIPIGIVTGGAALAGTAAVLRGMARLESDGSVLTEEAIGETGTVYLAIPDGGRGKVHVVLRGRLAELDAVSRSGAIPTGSPVLVTDVIEGDTLVVSPTNLLREEDHDVR